MLTRFGGVLICALLGCIGFRASGWDNPGHMAIAGLAYDELSRAQQVKLVALLHQHPDPSPVLRGFANGAPEDRELVMAMATWPDMVKRSHSYSNNGYEATAPAVTRVSFDHKMHKGWHFIDTPLWVGTGPAEPLPLTPKVNAVGVVKVLKAQLAGHESEQAKAYDLAWLLHLVGDLHQPLHAVDGVSEACPKGDEGGNSVSIHGVTHGERELHAYWDDVLGKSARSDRHTHRPRLDKDLATANQIIVSVHRVRLCADADDLDPAAWAVESYKMAKQDAYDIALQPVPGKRRTPESATLDAHYLQTATRDAKERVRAAGHRLALVLEAVLGPE